MKILAFAASSSKRSINQQLVRYATQLLDDDSIDVEIIDLNDYELPLFSEDREAELGQPQLAHDFLGKIAESDALVISFAEHNGSYTAAYKNTFDWASRIKPKVFQNKAMVMLSTSPGPGGASSVLTAATASAPYFDGDVKASLSIPSFYDNFDAESKQISNDDIKHKLIESMSNLINSRSELQAAS